jgi:hypothetical protein
VFLFKVTAEWNMPISEVNIGFFFFNLLREVDAVWVKPPHSCHTMQDSDRKVNKFVCPKDSVKETGWVFLC